jgi:hypothetical protein
MYIVTLEEEPMSSDTCIIVFPTSVRVFLNPNQAEKFYSRYTIERYLIRSPEHFNELYDFIQEETIANVEKQFGIIVQNKDELWNIAIERGDHVKTLNPGRSALNEDKDAYRHYPNLLKDKKQTFDWYPKQARIILETIIRSLPERFLEEDIRQVITNLVASGKLKTKQDPFYVFQYYRPRFIEDGFLTRGAH